MAEQCIRIYHDDGWCWYYSCLQNRKFDWDRNSLNQVAPVQAPHLLTESFILREAVSKMENGKAAGSSGKNVEADSLWSHRNKNDNWLDKTIIKGDTIPDDWLKQVNVNMYV